MKVTSFNTAATTFVAVKRFRTQIFLVYLAVAYCGIAIRCILHVIGVISEGGHARPITSSFYLGISTFCSTFLVSSYEYAPVVVSVIGIKPAN
jgi:hypothetical protein